MGHASEARQARRQCLRCQFGTEAVAYRSEGGDRSGPTDSIQNLQGPSPVFRWTGPVFQGSAIEVSLFEQPELEVFSLGGGKIANIVALPPVIRAEYGVFLQGATGGFDVGFVGLNADAGLAVAESDTLRPQGRPRVGPI